jgi:hypothetical protein
MSTKINHRLADQAHLWAYFGLSRTALICGIVSLLIPLEPLRSQTKFE